MIAELSQNQEVLIFAVILFFTAGVIRCVQPVRMSRDWPGVFVAFGLALFALAFILTP